MTNIDTSNPDDTLKWNIFGNTSKVFISAEANRILSQPNMHFMAEDMTVMGPSALKTMRLHKSRNKIIKGEDTSEIEIKIFSAIKDVGDFVRGNERTEDKKEEWEQHYHLLDAACNLAIAAYSRQKITIDHLEVMARTIGAETKRLCEDDELRQRTISFVRKVTAETYATHPGEDAAGPQSHPLPGLES
ncbi:MAG: hypothetical protein DYH13_04810 [Alphaproteobacteria bacterium PRO2]|nr:hypothetical protein [Alphaproteobacteria bacterium PRO2]